MKRIRISVNLIHYFQDHRQLAKVFVKDDMQTIEDLQNHIAKLFNIDESFYLMCQNHYLPSVEDIHILNDNDLIYVVPYFNTEEKTIVKQKKNKDLANIETNIEVEKKSKKKKKKPTKVLEINENNAQDKNEENLETQIEEEKVLKKKKKRKKHIENVEKIPTENEEPMETSNIVEADNNTEVSKKKKRKTNEQTLEIQQENREVENNSSKTKPCELPANLEETRYEMSSKNKVNETIVFRGSNKFDSIFIRQNDVTATNIENNLEYNFVNETRRKRRRCISPGITSTEKQSEVEATLENNEKRKKSIVQTIENVSLNEHSELLKNIKKSPRQTFSLNDVLHFNNQTSSPATNEINKILENNTNRSALRMTRKQLSGVGKVLEFIKTEQESDDVSENNEPIYPMPKRKRIRTRKRKPKNIESTAESNEHSDQSVFIPPKTIAAPKVHIKFEDNLDTNANSLKDNQNGYLLKPSLDFASQDDFTHSTPLNKTLDCSKKLENPNKSSRISIDDIDPDKLPLMVETPAVNNIILFKKLKLGPDYNPTISNFILAEIVEVAKNGDELHLKVLEGHEELEDPIGGRFSFDLEDEEHNDTDYDKIQILERNALIDPKIVRNFES